MFPFYEENKLLDAVICESHKTGSGGHISHIWVFTYHTEKYNLFIYIFCGLVVWVDFPSRNWQSRDQFLVKVFTVKTYEI